MAGSVVHIVMLVFLSRNIYQLAEFKGLKPVNWVFKVIGAWILLVVVWTLFITFVLPIPILYILEFAAGYLGYYLVYRRLYNKPDSIDIDELAEHLDSKKEVNS